jgi:hypothetical protein
VWVCHFPIAPSLKFSSDVDLTFTGSGVTCTLIPQDEAHGLPAFRLKYLRDVFVWLSELP